MATLLPEGKQSFNNNAGAPLVGGKVYTYDAGTSTPRTTYSDAAGTVPNTNPVILDARGEATIFWTGAYKVVLKDAADVTLWTVDNIINQDIVDVGAQPKFSSSVATSIGGYPVGYVLQDNAGLNSYVNIVAANTTDFNTTPASIGVSWIPYAGQAATQSGSAMSAVAAGTVDAITATYSPALLAFTNGIVLRFRPTGVNTSTAPTFSPNGLTAKTIVKGANQPLLAGDIAGVAAWAEVQYDLTLDKWVLINPATVTVKQIQSISASVAVNALTISASLLSLDFRSTALGSGAVTTVAGAPANLVISSGSTLGTVNAVQSRIAVLAINNAGTLELAAVNIAGGNDLTETGVITTVAEGGAGAADSANVIYSTTARASVAYRVIGYIDSTQAVAGTWVTAPSTIQGIGGQALAALNSLGYGQTWQNVTGSRAFATTYYNTTGKPIVATIKPVGSASSLALSVSINGAAAFLVSQCDLPSGVANAPGTTVIPAGASYNFTQSGGSGAVSQWYELR